jgi:hypothetical protein
VGDDIPDVEMYRFKFPRSGSHDGVMPPPVLSNPLQGPMC